MNWTNWNDFAAMGGYAFYVWGAFGASALLIAGELWSLRARRLALRRAQDALESGFGGTGEGGA